MIERKKFDEAGGFDEELSVAYNDVALCFRLLELGYFHVVRNDVSLIHHESVSRGLDRSSIEKEERRSQEMKKLYEKHPQFAKGYDPCYNPNLISDRVDFAIDMKKASAHKKVKKLPEKEVERYQRVSEKEKILIYHVDFVEERGDLIQINGWVYHDQKKNNNHNKTRILLKEKKGDMYAVGTARSYRSDFQEHIGNKKNISFAGFETIFSTKNLPEGTYQVGLELDQIYVMCKEDFEVIKG